VLNLAAFGAALNSVSANLRKEFETNGIPLNFARDRLVQFS
jgi:hypothetical protein